MFTGDKITVALCACECVDASKTDSEMLRLSMSEQYKAREAVARECSPTYMTEGGATADAEMRRL